MTKEVVGVDSEVRLQSRDPPTFVHPHLFSPKKDGPNQVWAMDWMYDELFDGKRLWVLTVIDTWSRVCPVMRVCRSATAMEVIDALEQARQRHGLPVTIRVDQHWVLDLADARQKVEDWRIE